MRRFVARVRPEVPGVIVRGFRRTEPDIDHDPAARNLGVALPHFRIGIFRSPTHAQQMPEANTASTRAANLPKMEQGSSVTYSVRRAAASPARLRASGLGMRPRPSRLVQSIRRPNNDAHPSPTTAPTAGIGPGGGPARAGRGQAPACMKALVHSLPLLDFWA